MPRRRAFCFRILLCLFAVSFAGCFGVEETLTLKPDGSGSVRMKIWFPQVALRFLPGRPSADWLKPNLPDGVTLTKFDRGQGKTTFTDNTGQEHELASETCQFDLAFRNVASLNELRIRPDSRNVMAASAGATPGKASSQMSGPGAGPKAGPFQQVSLTKKDGRLHFRRIIQAARTPDEIESDRMAAPGSSAQPEVFDLRDSRMKITIHCPGKVVSHNAHKVDGRTLMWDFRLKDLQENQDRDWIVQFVCEGEGKE